jgi:hypothetical protein
MKTGYDVEDAVEQVCQTMYLKDFVVRSPKYKKKTGAEKEIADFLVLFHDALLAFQVKSKQEFKPSGEKDENDYRRINARIEHGIDQLKTIKKALEGQLLEEVQNLAGISIPFNSTKVDALYGIVIMELLGEELFPKEERTEILNGFGYKHGMPIHVFLLSDFKTISTEIDTLPDFIDYLEVREFLYAKGILSPYTSELDFLAVYKTRQDWIESCIDGKCDSFFIDEGIWEAYQHDDRTSIQNRNSANEPSYIIDEIITQLRHSIGYTPDIKNIPIVNAPNQGSIMQYWQSINILSELRRLNRRVIGQKFLEKMMKADRTGRGYSVTMLDDETACLVFSANRSRQERMMALHNLSAMTYCGLGLQRLIGIASEPLSSQQRSYDVMYMEKVTFENTQELKQMFAELFGNPQHIEEFEYIEERNKREES